ncbi:hypothetical protein BH11VER1_BH11VER1_26200 [soil metagenome]
MPELAEVYYYSTQWNVGHGKPIRRVHVNPQARVYRGSDASDLADHLIGARLKHTQRTVLYFALNNLGEEPVCGVLQYS